MMVVTWLLVWQVFPWLNWASKMSIVQLTHGEEEEALGSVEVAVLTMACLVFLGAFIAVLCICCIKMKRFVL